MSAASMIAMHMNAPYGPFVSEQDVAASLQSGHFSASSHAGNDILSAMFQEVAPALIIKAAVQTHASLATVKMLYSHSLQLGLMPSSDWEQHVGAIA